MIMGKLYIMRIDSVKKKYLRNFQSHPFIVVLWRIGEKEKNTLKSGRK